ncbi:MAG: hypothetical protein COV67_12960 [Nitrospinae bacterium CG11_big_fil_rev_8_21_14_0_20_56_8]|nr:MAG: hypothetical protein COV67_12960 [Nitrospinae bacterium CG11_big_fil_rev_8_21_14_0_20_56_8]
MNTRYTKLTGILLLGALLLTGSPGAEEEGAAGLDKIVTQIEHMFSPVEGYVISLDGDKLILDLKQGQDVKPGDRLKLIRYGEELVHPVTHEKVGRKETDLGEVEVLEVRQDFSVARPATPEIKAQTGDGVRSPFKKLRFLVAAPETVGTRKVDTERLQLNLEKKLNDHPRFEVPVFPLGIWLLENNLDLKGLRNPAHLDKLRQKVQADYILHPQVKSIKGKMVLSYQLYSTVDGSVKQEAQILSEELPVKAERPRPRVRETEGEQETQTSFNRPEEGMLQFAGKQTFSFELVDFDIGDINGDGKKEFVFIDNDRVMIYEYEEGKFKPVSQFKNKSHLNRFLSVDVGDINHNGRDEIFVTNQVGDKLESFILEAAPGKGLRPSMSKVNLYFRIIRSFDRQPTLLVQAPGFNDPFEGPIHVMNFENGHYVKGPALQLPEKYGLNFILYGFNHANLTKEGGKETIILDKDYHLRVYSPSGRIVVKSDEYYGHDPRRFSLGVKEDGFGIVRQGEPVGYRGRLELVSHNGNRYLLIPRNHKLGGSLLPNVALVSNASLSVLQLTREGFVNISETRKQPGYVAAFQVLEDSRTGNASVHMVAVDSGGVTDKTLTTIYSYKWRD